jgi:hypothetical protein
VVLSGGPVTREDTALLEELEERGYAVLPLNCTGLNAVESEGQTRAGKNLIESLALAAFAMPTCTRSRPNPRYIPGRRDAQTSGATGLIVKPQICDHWYTERTAAQVLACRCWSLIPITRSGRGAEGSMRFPKLGNIHRRTRRAEETENLDTEKPTTAMIFTDSIVVSCLLHSLIPDHVKGFFRAPASQQRTMIAKVSTFSVFRALWQDVHVQRR